MPIILATQEAEIRRIASSNQFASKQFVRPYLEKPYHKTLSQWSGSR
jgi:hypothetical protein